MQLAACPLRSTCASLSLHSLDPFFLRKGIFPPRSLDEQRHMSSTHAPSDSEPVHQDSSRGEMTAKQALSAERAAVQGGCCHPPQDTANQGGELLSFNHLLRDLLRPLERHMGLCNALSLPEPDGLPVCPPRIITQKMKSHCCSPLL